MVNVNSRRHHVGGSLPLRWMRLHWCSQFGGLRALPPKVTPKVTSKVLQKKLSPQERLDMIIAISRNLFQKWFREFLSAK